MRSEQRPVSELDSVDWEEVQAIVRAFRAALDRGEQPAIEALLPGATARRKAALVELVHEEMEFRLKANQSFRLESYLQRFGDLAADPAVVRELRAAESALRERTASDAQEAAAAETSDFSPPPRRIGRYELGKIIGHGAFGLVYRAWDTRLNRAVALKRLRPGLLDAPGVVRRFLREARSAAALVHLHIVPVFDSGEFDGEPYLVTPLVDGCNLAEKVATDRPSVRQAAEWVATLADALGHAHRCGVIHRDVKPSNVLLDRHGTVYLSDFGLARSEAAKASLTIDGQVMGTPAYMAPEQARGEQAKIDNRTDIYSLGVILYQLLTGTRPFVGADAMVLLRIQVEDPKPPRLLDAAIPPDLETVCLKAMAKEPGRRYATAADFAADLRRYLQGEPVLARPEGRIRMIVRKCRRRPMLSGLAASLVLAILAGLAGATWEWLQAEFHRRRAQANLVRVQEQRVKAVHALAAGNRALTRLAVLANDQILGKSDRGSGELYTLLFEQYRGLVDTLSGDPVFLPELADASLRIALVLDDSSPPPVWQAAWRESLTLHEELVRRQPTNIEYQMNVGESRFWLGHNLRQNGESVEGNDHLRGSRQIWRGLCQTLRDRLETTPGDRTLKKQLCLCELKLGGLGSLLGERAEGIAALRNARELARVICQEEPADRESAHRLGLIDCELSLLLRDDRPAESVSAARSAVDQFDVLLRADPLDTLTIHRLAAAIDRLAAAEDHGNRPEDAMRDFRRAARLYERLLRDRPFHIIHRSRLATVLHQIGRILVETGRPAEALEPYRKAVELREALLSLAPENVQRSSDCAGTWRRLGEARENLRRIAAAVEAYQRCLVHQRRVCTGAPGNAAARTFLDEQLGHTSWLLFLLGRSHEAAELVRERKALRPGNPTVEIGAAIAHAAAIFVRHRESFPLAIIAWAIRRDTVHASASARDGAHVAANGTQQGVRPAAAAPVAANMRIH
jgi:tetratricopeptide (TPR) repeat protein/tRNA A-37 threonylcarbamoyl transferase component Bud32